ncbi:MAG: cytochrome c [Gemmatimonadota bacterium]
MKHARTMRPLRHAARLLPVALLTIGLGGCDDQVKRVPWFRTMTEQVAVQTYEGQPPAAPEGAVAVGQGPAYTLAEADTLLTNPTTPSDEGLEAGKVSYAEFCLPCHGESGVGDGPVVGPNRLPPLPFLNLLTERAAGLSDGYMWGMLENGRGVMPSYRRIPRDERWLIVNYVRSLQAQAAPPAEE